MMQVVEISFRLSWGRQKGFGCGIVILMLAVKALQFFGGLCLF